MDLTTNFQNKAIEINISKSMPLMDQNSNNSRLIEVYNNSTQNPSLCHLQSMAYDDKSCLGIHNIKDSLKSLVNDKPHVQSLSSADSKTLSPSSCQSNWDSSQLQQEVISSPSSDHQNVKSSNGSGAPYKELTWREKDRRRRFREEWKQTWMVVPHGNYEVLCLICQKIMTQRKLDTIKRHTVRRHSEILTMDDTAKCHYFEQLTAKYGLTNAIETEEHSTSNTTGGLVHSDSIDESSMNEVKDLSVIDKNDNFEHFPKRRLSMDEEPSSPKKKKHIDGVYSSSLAKGLNTTQSPGANSSTANCHLSSLSSCSMPPNSISPTYAPTSALTFRPQIIIPPSSSPPGKSQSSGRCSLTSFDRGQVSPAMPNPFNLPNYSYMCHDMIRRPYFPGHLPFGQQTFPHTISQLGAALTSPKSLSEHPPFWCSTNFNFQTGLNKSSFMPPLLTQQHESHKSADISMTRSNHFIGHDLQSTSNNFKSDSKFSPQNVKKTTRCLSSVSSPESNLDVCGLSNAQSPVLSKSSNTPLSAVKPRKVINGYHPSEKNNSLSNSVSKLKSDDSGIENSSQTKTILRSPHFNSPAKYSGPLLCDVLRYHKEQDVLQCLNKLLLSTENQNEICILSCSGELSKVTLSYRCRSDTSSVVSKAVTHEGPLEILSMSCSLSNCDVVGDRLRLTISLTDSNGCVIGGRVGGPIIAGNDGVEIVLGYFQSNSSPVYHQQKRQSNSPLLTYSIDNLSNDYCKTGRKSLSKGKRFRVGMRSKSRISVTDGNLANTVNNNSIKRKRPRLNAIRKSMNTNSS